MDEPAPERLKHAEQAMDYVIQRMLEAGWLHNEKTTGKSGWTELGTKRAHQLREIFNELNTNLTGEEMTTLLVIIDRVSPGAQPHG